MGELAAETVPVMKGMAKFMNGKRIVAYACAAALAAGLMTSAPSPVFAAEILEETAGDAVQVLEEHTDTVLTERAQVTPSDAQQEDDGLVYVDGAVYSGYYMDGAGIMYIVSNGAAQPVTQMAGKGTAYYSAAEKMQKTLPGQTAFVAGKAYTGYCMDSKNKMYYVKSGSCALKTGTVKKGTEYYSYKESRNRKLTKQTLYVKGKVYSGYYMDSKNKMYHVKKGTCTLKTGTVKKGTSYYSYQEGKNRKLTKQTLYVKGKAYTGYYMDSKNKMYHVKKGTCTLKTGTVKKGTGYYSYKAKKNRKLSKQTLYVKGKAYTGYYMDSKNKMYHVKKGSSTLKTGMVKEGTEYYSYKAKKYQKLSKQTLYVKGKVYTGYYMDSKNKMHYVEQGNCTLLTGTVQGGTGYYSYSEKKDCVLPSQTLYVDGAVYNGYYLGADNRMYFLSNGTYTPVDTVLNMGTAYYSCNENRVLALPCDKLYLDGKAVESLTPNGVAVFQKARAVVQSVSNPADSKEDKLYKCYLWIKKCPYIQYRTTMDAINADPVDWDATFANDIFDSGAGCCVSLSCAFAYMAKACGFERVTICSDTKHAWVDIDGRLYDPLFAKDRNFSTNYNAAYTDYRVHAAFTKEL